MVKNAPRDSRPIGRESDHEPLGLGDRTHIHPAKTGAHLWIREVARWPCNATSSPEQQAGRKWQEDRSGCRPRRRPDCRTRTPPPKGRWSCPVVFCRRRVHGRVSKFSPYMRRNAPPPPISGNEKTAALSSDDDSTGEAMLATVGLLPITTSRKAAGGIPRCRRRPGVVRRSWVLGQQETVFSQPMKMLRDFDLLWGRGSATPRGREERRDHCHPRAHRAR
jgi:hypothetical protein